MKLGNLDRVTLLAFVSMVFLAGLNGIGVRYTVMELPPFWGATLRFVPGSLILLVITLMLRLPMPRGRSLQGALLFGALNFGASFAFIYWGAQKVQPGMYQVLLALVPLLTLIFTIVHRQEVFRWRALAGSLFAVLGIALVFGEQVRANVPIPNLLAIILGAACIAEANVIVKGYPMGHPIPTNVVSMASGSVILFLMSLIFHETRAIPTRITTWLSLAYLILFGSCAVFILVLFVLKRWSASANSYSFVLFPFVTITVSALLTNEKLSLPLFIGAAFVIAGVYIGAIGINGERMLVKSPAPQVEDASSLSSR